MWYGKLSIIMFIYSLSILFSSYYLNQIFNDSVLSQSATYQSLNNLMGTFSFNQTINTNLIFGDFISVFTLLGSLMSGSIFTSSLTIIQNSGFGDMSVGLLMGLLFDSATLFLLLYIVSNRSV